MLKASTDNQVIPWRFEYKYRITVHQYYRLKNDLIIYMEPDSYTRKAEKGRYLVRSLYFDNDQFQAYYEKIEGNFGRIKCRIRTYSETLVENTPIRVELKNRWGESIEKYSTFVSTAEYLEFMSSRHWARSENPVLQEFERIYYLRAMQPKVLVSYDREGFVPRSREDLRVTLDHDVKSCLTGTLFPKPALFKDHHRHSIVLEIKCRRKQPAWLSQLVRKHGLKYIANSKYTQGVEAVRPDLLSPY
ncbi:MAG: polyphosphate polymerase domain-containing protein [Firmicutes bacterium]|nr:polyphosphate polymerase domain-containing protein [Bacillota bacterium]